MVWPVNARTSAMMDEAQTLYGATITATQGSPSTSVSASAGTHDGEGVIDVVGADLDAIVTAMRTVGFAAWHRTAAEGFTPHVHGVAVGEPGLSPAAADQVTDYLEGRNGLATNAPDDGPRDWVGLTWEDYLLGNPAPGGNTPFRGLQIIAYRAVVTSGAPTGSAVRNAIRTRDTGTVTLTAGTEFYASLEPATTASTDVYSMSNWRLNVSGTGVLQLAESFDTGPTFTTPSSWTDLGTVTVDSVTAGLTATEALPKTPANIDGSLGDVVIKVTCTSGTVVLDWLCLQVEPPAGLLIADTDAGYWSPYIQAPDYSQIPNGYVDSAVAEAEVSVPVGGADQQELLDEALDIARLGDQTGAPFQFSSLAFAGGDIFTETHAGVTLGQTVFTFHAGTGVLTARDATPAALDDLVLGVDYILRPGKTIFDVDAYVEYESDGPNTLHGWTWIANYLVSASATGSMDVPIASYRLGVDLIELDWVTDHAPWVEYGEGTQVVSFDGPQSGTMSVPLTALGNALDWAAYLQPTWMTDDGPSGSDGISQIAGYLAGTDTTSIVHAIPPQRPTLAYQMPRFHYWHPGWVRSPDALDTSDPEGVVPVTWLRQRQRNDGLGNSVTRARGVSSRQLSLRQRGYR